MSLAVNFIKAREGLRLLAYRDSAGVWTIGYGHTGPEVVRGYRIDAARAEALLIDDMEWAVKEVSSQAKVPLTTQQAAALTSFVFNIGPRAFSESTCLRKLNTGDYEGAANAMTLFNKITVKGKKVRSDGLAARREMERALFLSGMVFEDAPKPEAPGAIVGGETKPMIKSKTQWLAGVGLSGLLADALGAFNSLRMSLPGNIEAWGPAAVLAVIFAGIMLNRLWDSYRGEH